jgi:hypothetical protein
MNPSVSAERNAPSLSAMAERDRRFSGEGEVFAA